MKLDIDSDGCAECPDCGQKIKLGPAGLRNLKIRHMGSDACKAAQVKRDKDRARKKDGSLLTFFNKPKPVLNPPTVKAREILHSTLEGPSNAALISGVPSIESPLLQRLYFIHQNLTRDVLEATENDVLARFSEDPASFDNPEVGSEELWEEVLNPVMKSILGWGDELDTASMVWRGEKGMLGVYRFVKYFTVKRGVDESLFEGKLSKLLDIAETW